MVIVVVANDNARAEKPDTGDDTLHDPTRVGGTGLPERHHDER